MNNNIDIYSNSIYDYDLIVASSNVTLEELQKSYEYTNGDPLDSDITNPCASCCTVRRKSDCHVVCLVKLNHYDGTLKTKTDKQFWLINTCSHEALHYLFDLCNAIYQTPSVECQEPFAYILGWATECIYKTWTKKTNDTHQKRKQTKR